MPPSAIVATTCPFGINAFIDLRRKRFFGIVWPNGSAETKNSLESNQHPSARSRRRIEITQSSFVDISHGKRYGISALSCNGNQGGFFREAR